MSNAAPAPLSLYREGGASFYLGVDNGQTACYGPRVMKPDTETTLRIWRRSSGLSLRSLASLSGIHKGRLSAIERGLTPDEWARVAKVLGGTR